MRKKQYLTESEDPNPNKQEGVSLKTAPQLSSGIVPLFGHNPFSFLEQCLDIIYPTGRATPFSSIMEAPLIARLSAIFNFVPAHGRKQTGWRYWCVTAVKSLHHSLMKGKSCICVHYHSFKDLFFQGTNFLKFIFFWLGMKSCEHLLRCRMGTVRSMSLFMSKHPATISATLRPDPFHSSFLRSFLLK